MKKQLFIAIALLILGLGGVFIALSFTPNESAAETPPVQVRRGNLIETAAASGTIEPHVQIAVKSRASGEVIEVLVEEGDIVEAGDVLVRLDPRDAEQDVTEAEMALDRARSDLTQSRANYRVAQAQAEEAQAESAVRNRGFALGLISSEDQRAAASSADVARANVTSRQAQIAASRLSVESAELRVEEAERRLEETTIFAPVSGTVLAVDVEIGSIVASGITNVNGGTTLMTVADLSDLRVIGDIDEAQVGSVAEDQEVTIRVDAYPTQTFTGQVARVSPLGQTQSNIVTFDVEILIIDEDAHLLRSGMSADLEIVTERHEDVPLLPITAVQTQGRRQMVTLANGERRRVVLGPTDGMRMVVLEGLEGGELLASASTARASRERAEGNRSKNKSLIPMGRGRKGR